MGVVAPGEKKNLLLKNHGLRLTRNLTAIRFVPVINTPIYSAQDRTKYFSEVLVQ